MTTSTLTKWGNGQGILIPKSLCDKLGLSVGDKVTLELDGNRIDIRPQRATFKRSRNISIDAIFKDWNGAYQPPADWDSAGAEVDWGKPAGKEIW